MKNRLTTLLLASLFTLIISTAAYAGVEQTQAAPGNVFDVGLLFEEDGQPMELAMLSEREMEETQGAWIPAVIAGLFAIRFARYAWGPIKHWFRPVGKSHSRSSGFDTYGARWGTNRHYREEIGSSRLRDLNARLRDTRLPGNGWRTQDPGHLHFSRRVNDRSWWDSLRRW